MKMRLFTMIEILSVVTIILVLMGLLIPSIGVVLRKAKISKTKTAVRILHTAIKQYESVYGFLPLTGVGTDIIATGSDRIFLLKTLCADSSVPLANPKKIKFIECDYDTIGNPVYNDAWNHPISISLDLDYSNSLDDATVVGYANAGTSDVLKTSVAAWSLGPDEKEDSVDKHDDNDDNVNSWD